MAALRSFFLFALLILPLASACRAQSPWADSRYLNRVEFSFTNNSGHAFSAGDVVSATISSAVIGGRIKADGSDAVAYFSSLPLPSRALVMGGSVKVLLPLQAALGNGGRQTGYTLYFNSLQTVAAPAMPPGVQGWDFSDGSMHGWQSLQDPAGAPDVKIAADGTYGNALVMDNSKYHHPIAFAASMTPMAEGTTYAKVRTGGGENECAVFQRFNTRIKTDDFSVAYVTGSDVAGAGLAVDSFGSQEMLITVGLGGPEGDAQRIHPGPGSLEPGVPYTASPDSFQYMVTATRDDAGPTTVFGDAWQAPVSSSGGDGDPEPSGFSMYRDTSANESRQPLNAGVVGIMNYYSTLSLHWMYAVPNPWAEYLGTSTGSVETSAGPGAGLAIVKGITYYQPVGLTAPIGGLTVTVKDASKDVLATGASGTGGAFQFIIAAGPTPRQVIVTATGTGITGSATASIVEDTTNTINVPVTFTSQITGKVTDARGAPVAGAAVGRPIDGLPWVFTAADGTYTLPVPAGTVPVGAHKDGFCLSGPRWTTGSTADFTLLPASANILLGNSASVWPFSGQSVNVAALTDGNTASSWTSGPVDGVSTANPMTIRFNLSDATVNEIDVHWKHYPAAWRVEMTNSGGTRTYYSAGATSAGETGCYLAPGSVDRHVVPIKTAVVTGVTSITIVVTGVSDSDQLSIYEVVARSEEPVSVDDAAAAMRIAAGFQTAPNDYNAFNRWNAYNDDSRIDVLDAVTLARDLGREVKPLRVLVINYQPKIESSGGIYLRQVYGWSNPYTNTENHRKDIELASHDYLRVYLLPQIEVDEYPLFLDGTRYDDATYIADTNAHSWNRGNIDYNAMISEFDLVRRVDSGDVDEVWVQAVPGFGMWETTMAGPNAYFCNSGPVPGTNGNRLFIITGFNYERGNDVMLEDWGHRSESILGYRVYGNWDTVSQRTTWDKFTRYEKVTPNQASCGNVHYPPNGTSDYDYANAGYVSSDADDWMNYPNFTGTRKQVNCSNWASPYDGDYHRNYHIWWFQRMPHVPGLGPDLYQANWWKYIVDMNSYPESR